MSPKDIAEEIIAEARRKNTVPGGDLIFKLYSVMIEVQLELLEFSDKYREKERKADKLIEMARKP